MLKESNIQEFLLSKNVNYNEGSSIWGVVFPKKTTYLFGSVATALSMQYYVLHFNDEGVAIIGINNITGKIEQGAFVFIPNSEIKKIQFQKKLISYKLKIETSKGNLAYRVNKIMIGTAWHKENLNEILKKVS